MVTNTRRTRLIVDVTPELQARIKDAAMARDETVRAYVATILEKSVPPLGARGTGIVTRDDLDRITRVRQRIMRGRVFMDNSADLIRASREERSEELAP